METGKVNGFNKKGSRIVTFAAISLEPNFLMKNEPAKPY